MNTNGLVVIIILLMLSNLSVAQQRGIFIIDGSNNTPISHVLVYSDDLDYYQTTDENGFVSLNNLKEGIQSIQASCIGYESISILVPTISSAKENPVIYLNPKITSLSEVTLNASSSTGIFKTISDLDIHLRPINNSQEILRMVPGLFIGQHAGGGKAEQIFLRGFDLDHGTDINISVDGMPANMVSHAHGQGYADLHFVIPELIEKVDFNKGPYFADKGNFTTAGFVEFKTKKYLENNFLKIEGGQFNTFRGVAGLNLLKASIDKRDQSLYVAGEGSFSKGYFDHPQDLRRFNSTLKYHKRINESHTITMGVSAFTSKWNASGQIPDRADKAGIIGFYGAIDPNEGGNTSRYNAHIDLMTMMNSGAILRNQVYYSKYNFELFSNFTFFKVDPVNGDQIKQKESRDIVGYNSVYQQVMMLGKFRSEAKTGIQIRYDKVTNVELSRTKDRTTRLENMMYGDVFEMNIGAFHSQTISISNRLDVTGAIRFDNFNNKYNDKLENYMATSNSLIFSPKLNFNYRMNENVQWYLYNGKGFHSNDTRVAVPQSGKKVLPPAYGTDLGGIFKLGEKLFLQSALWYLWLDQEFVYVGDEGVVEPGGQTRRFGLDVSTRYEMFKNLYVDLDLSFANPRAIGGAKGEQFLPLAPMLTSVGGITYRKVTGWNGSLRYRYMGDRPANETNTVIAKGYLIADAVVQYTTRRWEAGISIQNLFNSRWKETQFDTESQLENESFPVSEIHFTPGSPFFARLNIMIYL